MTTGVIDTGTNLPLAALTSVANLPVVPLTLAVNFLPVSTTLVAGASGVYLEFQMSSQKN
jgi:hypothetical protein